MRKVRVTQRDISSFAGGSGGDGVASRRRHEKRKSAFSVGWESASAITGITAPVCHVCNGVIRRYQIDVAFVHRCDRARKGGHGVET